MRGAGQFSVKKNLSDRSPMKDCEYYLPESNICGHPSRKCPVKTSEYGCTKCILPRKSNNYNLNNVCIEELLSSDNAEILSFLLAISPQLTISFNYTTQKLEISFFSELCRNDNKLTPPVSLTPDEFEFEISADKFEYLSDDPIINRNLNVAMLLSEQIPPNKEIDTIKFYDNYEPKNQNTNLHKQNPKKKEPSKDYGEVPY